MIHVLKSKEICTICDHYGMRRASSSDIVEPMVFHQMHYCRHFLMHYGTRLHFTSIYEILFLLMNETAELWTPQK